MTREEAIDILDDNFTAIDTHGHYTDEEVEQARQMAIKALKQESCEDECIKVPKKALKYRTAGMVAYNAEWLKNHFDIERAAICGAQQPCDDCISRQDALDCLTATGLKKFDFILDARDKIKKLPSVTPQPKTGHWIDDCGGVKCSCCGYCIDDYYYAKTYCPNCGCRMESEVTP